MQDPCMLGKEHLRKSMALVFCYVVYDNMIKGYFD